MLASILILIVFVSANPYYDKVLLSEVTDLILRNGELTVGRKNKPIQHLNCEYPPADSQLNDELRQADCQYGPQYIKCRNCGKNILLSDSDFIWECVGYGMTPGYILTNGQIGCEGYDYPDDPYILKGSCWISYKVYERPKYQYYYDHLTVSNYFLSKQIYR